MFTYDQHHIDAFGDTVRLLSQQKISKLEGSILTRDDVHAAIDHWDRLGQIAFKKRSTPWTTEHVDTARMIARLFAS